MNALEEYKKTFLHRNDEDPSVPYFHTKDFDGLRQEIRTFSNARGDVIKTFRYSYEGKASTPVFFCPGMGPGHEAYLREIELLARNGFDVYTIDYAGTGYSGGPDMGSFHEPALDCWKALEVWGLSKEGLSLMGHSLGGFTVANLLAYDSSFGPSIILSGLLSGDGIAASFGENGDSILNYESDHSGVFRGLDLVSSFCSGDRPILWIHSADDPVVPYERSAAILEKNNANPRLEILKCDRKGHNPNYSESAVLRLSAFQKDYAEKKRSGYLESKANQEAFRSSQDLWKLTEQDPEVWSAILSFLKRGIRDRSS